MMSTSNENNNKMSVKATGVRNSQVNIAGGNITNISNSAPSKLENTELPEVAQSLSGQVDQRSEDGYSYDVFISYSHFNKKWVWGWLLPRLRKAGIRVCIDLDSFEPGAPVITEIERAIMVSRKVLLVLTPSYVKSEWTELENILTASQDPAARKRRLLPIMVEKCELPLRLRALTYMDFMNQQITKEQMDRLIASLLPKQSVSNSTDKDVYSLTESFRPSDENDLGDDNHFQLKGLKSTTISLPKSHAAQCASWQRQLSEYEYSLRLIEERISEHVESTYIPLDLVKRKRQVEQRIIELTAIIVENCSGYAEKQEETGGFESNGADMGSLLEATDLPPVQRRLDVATTAQIQSLKEKLLIHQKNLAQLEIQAAKCGRIDVPLRLLNQIDDEKQEIQRIEGLLK
jgi:hypothetical protein